MKMLGGILRLLLFVAVGTLMMASQAHAANSCHNIKGKGIGQDLGGGVTEARILGGGLLHGTTEGNLTPTGFSGTVASFIGTVEFTTNNGTLTVSIEGTLDIATGEFGAEGTVTDSTGKLAGATGNLVFDGIEDLSDGTFVEDVAGRICVDLRP